MQNYYETFGKSLNLENNIIVINIGSSKDFNIIASKYLIDLHFNGDTQFIPLYRYDEAENRTDNITDWARAVSEALWF